MSDSLNEFIGGLQEYRELLLPVKYKWRLNHDERQAIWNSLQPLVGDVAELVVKQGEDPKLLLEFAFQLEADEISVADLSKVGEMLPSVIVLLQAVQAKQIVASRKPIGGEAIDLFEAMHDELKSQDWTDGDIAKKFLDSRRPAKRNELLQKHGSREAAIVSLTRRCEYIRRKRKQ